MNLAELRAERLRRLYQQNPLAYMHQVLGMTLTPQQEGIVESVRANPRTMVIASHGVGKSAIMGALTNWHFDVFQPGLTITTAPTANQVVDVLWKEVRKLRRGRPGLLPKAPRMETAPDHWAMGLTANTSDAFQGRHEEHVLLVFDEAVGVDGQFWDGAEGMMTTPERRWAAIMNPTNPGSRAYREFCSGRWNVIQVSALTHPNVLAWLEGRPAPFPAAVQATWVDEKVRQWCIPVAATLRELTDIEWPPGSGYWHRPGPEFESRVLGRWPSSATNTVWSQAVWELCLEQKPIPQEPLVVGVDVARFGDDFTTIHARRGACSLFHEAYNSMDLVYTAGRVPEVARSLLEKGEDPQSVLIVVDDDGVGGGVTDILKSLNWDIVRQNGSARAREPDSYRNARSEMWFAARDKAADGRVDVSRLSEGVRAKLMTQLMAPTYSFDAEGRRVVESKDQTKKRIGRSPDDADSFLMSHYGRERRVLQVFDL